MNPVLFVLVALFAVPSTTLAQTCPLDAGKPCDTGRDDDLCNDGTLFCVAGVPDCREGPLILLTFDEGSGPTIMNAADEPQVGDATVGPAVGFGGGHPNPGGSSVEFPGADTNAWVKLDIAEALSKQFTWAFWMQPKAATTTVFSRTTSNSVQGLTYATDGTVMMDGLPYATPAPTGGAWTHVAITYDGAALRVYHDGVIAADIAVTVDFSWISHIWFGQRQGLHNGAFSGPNAYAGALDEITYHDYALLGTAVFDLFAVGVPVSQKNRELCDGLDNDCRASTVDPVGQPCDGPDSDECEHGTATCAAGGVVVECLNETIEDIPEVCNFADENCNNINDDGIGVGDGCDGPDPDTCDGGRKACDGSGGVSCGIEPLLYFDFELTDGPGTVVDRTSWHHGGQLENGATVGVGKNGGGLALSGGAQRLSVFQSNRISSAFSKVTVAFWVKPADNSPSVLLEKLGYITIARNGSGGIGVSRDGSTPSAFYGNVVAGSWAHVMVTIEGQTVITYVDGTAVGTGTHSEGYFDAGGLRTPLRIGGATAGSGFVGQLDELLWFNRVLNQAERGEVFADSLYYTYSNEVCGVAPGDANCNGIAQQPRSVGCTVQFLDVDQDGAGAQTIVDMKPTAYWSMDDVTVSGQIEDWSGNGFHLPVQNPAVGVTRRVPGQVGRALSLDFGQNQDYCVADTYGSKLQLDGDATYAAWVYLDTLGFEQAIVHGGATQIFTITGAGKLSLKQGAGSAVSTGAISSDTWTHVAVVRTGASVAFYINGVFDSGGALASTSVNLKTCLGGRGASERLNGILDEVVIFNRALSGPSIAVVAAAADHECLCGPVGDFDTVTRGDCNDSDSTVGPGAPETCDSADNDCNGLVDDLPAVACTPSVANSGCAEGLQQCEGGAVVCGAAPYGYWNLDEGSGRVAHNRIVEGRSLELTGTAAAWVTGHSGGGVDTDVGKLTGVLPTNAGFNSSGGVAFWFKPSVAPSAVSQSLVSFGTAGATRITTTSTGFLRVLTASSSIDLETARWLQRDTWSHIALIWDGSGGSETIQLFIDGRLADSRVADFGAASQLVFDGLGVTDDIVLYHVAPTPTQVRVLFEGTVPTSQQVREFCDGVDNDCDGETDEAHDGWVSGSAAIGATCDTDDADTCSDGVWACQPFDVGSRCTDGPIGLYTFEGADPTKAKDRGGDLGDATFAGTRPSGHSGNGIGLTATDDVRVDNPSAARLEFGTFGVWVGPSAGAANAGIVGLYSPGGAIRVSTSTASTLIRLDVGGENVAVGSPAFGSTWHHLAVTWDQSLDEVVLYVNGVRKQQVIGIDWTQFGAPDWLGVGAKTGNTYPAPYDDFVVYRRALTEAEVAALVSSGVSAAQSNAEVCDGNDNDCDSSVDEGYGVGGACDATDADQCTEGQTVCADAFTGRCERDGPIVYYPMDDGGDEVLDHSGSGLHGQSSGTISATGRIGKARQFDGINDSVALPDFEAFDVDTPGLTIAAWVRPDTDAVGTIFEWAGVLGLRRNGDQTISFDNGPGAGGFCYTCNGKFGFVPKDNWTHVAVTWNGTDVSYYVNASSVGGHALARGTLDQDTVPFVGCSTDGEQCTSARYSGLVDELVVYPYALSDTEVLGIVGGVPGGQRNAPLCGADANCDGSTDADGSINCTSYWVDGDGDGYGQPDWVTTLQPQVYLSLEGPATTAVLNEGTASITATRRLAPTVHDGIRGKAIAFDEGSRQSELRVPLDVHQSATQNEMTTTFWFKRDAAAASQPHYLFDTDNAALFVTGTARLSYAGAGGSVQTSAVLDDRWYWVVLSVRGGTASSAVDLRLYDQSGLVDQVGQTGGAANFGTSLEATLGRRVDGTSGFSGAVDEVAVWPQFDVTGVAAVKDDTSHVCACAPPSGMTATLPKDCDPATGTTYPGAPELCDSIDQDCDGTVDNGADLSCDDGKPCTVDTCGGGTCNTSVAPNTCHIAGVCYAAGDLSPASVCSRCEPSVSGSTFTDLADGSACSDNDACTENDECLAGACSGTPRDCNDNNSCTLDSCDAITGCTYADNDGATVSCYSGDPATIGIGECVAGTTVCTGSTPGACAGEVTPVSELCDGKDNDCDGAPDENFNVGDACDSGDPGQCADGTIACDSTASSSCLNDGPVLWAPFESVSGVTTPNVSWGGKSLFLQGGASTGAGPAGFGNAVELDGINDYVGSDSLPQLNGDLAQVSIGFQVRKDNILPARLFTTGTSRLSVGVDGVLTLRFPTGGDHSSEVVLATGTWTHVAVVFDAGIVDFYIDGVRYSRVDVGQATFPFAGSFALGRPSGPGLYLNGAVDDVIIETSAWSPARVFALAQPSREACDGGDSNCDGTTDEGFAKAPGACDSGDTDQCEDGTGQVCHPLGFDVTCQGDGPTWHFAMEALTGRFVLPASGSAAPLLVENATLTAGKSGQALHFGGDTRAVLPIDTTASSVPLAGGYGFWVRFDAQGDMTILSKEASSGQPELAVSRFDGFLRVRVKNTLQTFPSAVMPEGIWHHVAIDISGDTVVTWLNAENLGSFTHSSPIVGSQDAYPLLLGGRAGGSSSLSRALRGDVDEFVYDSGGFDQTAVANLVMLGDSCNNFDDDCDGTVDEDFPTTGDACGGGGDCATAGTFVCTATLTDLECTPSSLDPPGTGCDDGDVCTHTDQCDGTGGCAGTSYACDDGLPCTDNICNGDGTCSFPPKPGTCAVGGVCYDDGDIDTTNECLICDVASDQNALTNRPDGTTCDDSSLCTVTDTCQSGTCTGPALACDDGDDCTVDACDAAAGCIVGSVLSGGEACEDGDLCTENTVCATGGACVGGNAVDCDDNNPCTEDSCNVAVGCVYTVIPHTEACYSGPAGTVNVGLCAHGTRTCSGSVLGPCIGQVGPTADICDGQDNNCDGDVDEGFPTKGDACDGPDTDTCENGTLTCKTDGSGLECTGDVQAVEICDGKDNNCDGNIDEGFLNLGDPCDSPDDSDSCMDGIIACSGGVAACVSDGPVISLTGTNATRYIATDVSGTGNDAKRFGYPTNPGTGPFHFDGVDDRMVVPASATTTVTDRFSIVLHVNREDAGGAVSVFESRTGGCSDVSIRINASGAPFALVEQSPCGLTSLTVGSALTVGTWYHLALVADGSNYTLYVDGVAKSVKPQSGPLFEVGDLVIGAFGNGTVPYKGRMGEIALYRYALAPADVATLSAQFSAPGGAQVEICDGADNNCDGVADEHATTEVCDGRDNNCDGDVDEGYAGIGDSCDTGDPDSCAYGARACLADGTGVVCGGDGAAALYRFEAGSGSTVSDYAAANHLTVTGGTWAAGRIQGGLSLTASDSGTLSGGAAFDVPATGAFSLLAQINPTTLSDANIVARSGAWSLAATVDGDVVCTIAGVGVAGADVSATAPVALSAGNWAALACLYDGEGVRLYVEGTLAAVGHAAGGAVVNSGDVVLGGLEATYDDVAAFGVALSEAQVAAWATGGIDSQYRTREICDGADNNCNAVSDEGYETKGDSCDGDFDGCENGTLACDDAGNLSCAGDIPANGTELCNGLDDTCDGVTDEGFEAVGDPCDGNDVDSCENGSWACKADGTGLTCVGDNPVAETCNGIDDDCNGATDEAFQIGVACDGPDPDECAGGAWACKSDGSGRYCHGDGAIADFRLTEGSGTSVQSLNGEGLTGSFAGTVTWATGPNKAALDFDGGAKVTVSSVPSVTQLTLYARGTSDSAGNATLIGRNTNFRLTVSASGLSCNIAGLAPIGCSAALTGHQDSQHDFACTFDGSEYALYYDGLRVETCAATGAVAVATGDLEFGSVGGSDAPVQLERASLYDYALTDADVASLVTGGDACDGTDNDCDGATDEDYPTKGDACDGADADVCTDGQLTCTADRLGLECTGEGDDTELCDGLDNDCDGVTDEDFPGVGDLCDGPDGDVCENGTIQCKADGSGTECVGDLNQPELCDGLDNDCNGLVDDALSGLGAACDDADGDSCTDGLTWCNSDAGAVQCDEVRTVVWAPLLDPPGSSEAVDKSRFQRTLSATSVSFTGTEAVFDGTADITDVATMTDLTGVATATWSAWVKPDFGASPAALPVVTLLTDVSNVVFDLSVTQTGLRLRLRTTGQTGAGTTYECIPGSDGCTAVITDGAWTHVAAVFDTKTVSLFVDGVRVRVIDATGNPIGALSGARLRIGSAPPNRYFGELRDVAVFERALNSAELAHLKDNGPTGETPELCNGGDDTCDGTADETFASQLNQACDGVDKDLCDVGTTACTGDGLGVRCKDSAALAWWTMDDTSGASVADHGQSGLDGTLRHNVTFATGAVDGAVQFGPSTGVTRIEVADVDLLAGGAQATWMAWIKTNSLTGTSPIISTYNPSGSPGPTWSFERSTDGLALRLRTTNSSNTKLVTCNSSTTCGAVLTAGAWTHVAVVANSGLNRFYVNGESKGAFIGGGSTFAAKKANERLVIGGYSDNSASWDGALDDVRIYDSAFSADQIRDVYERATDVAALDRCDGVDNDCDGATDEDYPTKDLPCDGVDADQCENGTWACTADGKGVECVNESIEDIVEECNGADDDCDGSTDEDFPNAGLPCDGPDADSCEEGIWECTASGGLTCQRDGPTGLWRLDTGGTIGVDSASDSPHHDLSLNNVFWTTGRFGQALEFDGTGGNARANVGIGGVRTLTMWVRPSGDGYVFGESGGVGNVHFSGYWAGGALQYSHTDGGSTHILSGTLPADEWHHVAIVMEPGNNTNGLRLYIDCIQVDARGLGQNLANGEFTLGRVNGANQYFLGRVDEVAVFDYVVPDATLCDYVAGPVPDGNANRELCDTVDNDCSGTPDDGLTGTPGDICDGADSDLCENGTWTCRVDTVDVECVNESVTGIVEECNSADDDCDGLTDEDFTYQSSKTGFPCDPPGVCGSGVVECISPSEAGCSTGPGGSADQSGPEFCDDKDNDCDGDTDEKPDGTPVTENCYTGPAGTLNVGVCAYGQRTCVGGVFGACQDDVTPAATDDQCDGFDDNCDGVADEGWGDGIYCTIDNCTGGVQQPVPDDSRCDPGNSPCQNHICTADPSLPDGCEHTANNSLVPDPAIYGKPCKLATCSGGNVQYSPDPSNLPDDGLDCTIDICSGGDPVYQVKDGTCLIDGVCYAEGDINTADGCKVCAPTEDKTAWSNLLARGDFDSGTDLDGYTVTDLSGGGVAWGADALKPFNGTHALYFGIPSTHSYDAVGGSVLHARAESEVINVPAGVKIQLSWYVWMETEGYTGSEKYDTLFLYVVDEDTGTEVLVWDSMNAFGSHTDGTYRKAAVDLSSFAGKNVRLAWEFDTGDASFNDYEGVYLDEIRMRTGCCFNHSDCPTAVECSTYLCVDNQCEENNFCSVCKRSQTSVVFGLDRSLSMGGLHGSTVTRWSATRNVMSNLLASYDAQVNLGAKLISSSGVADVCNDVTPLLDLDFHSSVELVNSTLASENVEGGLSPIARTLAEINAAYATPAVQAEGGNKYVIMIVDGLETCEDDDAVFLQLAALRGQGVRTIFVAFDSVWTAAQKARMNDYAIAGGLPVVRTALGAPVYLSAGLNQASLETAVDQALLLTVREACNLVDDDCDGDTDENAPDLACNLTCNGGLGGKQVCIGGSYSACTENSIAEICDDKDNDCDGATDEDWPELGFPCSEGTGACFSAGVYECSGSLLSAPVECNAPPIAGTAETCNDIDDDCDGDTDEGLTQICATPCGTGEATCVSGKFVNCDAEVPTTEVCDGLDNDCNNVVDDVVPVPCTGACGGGFQVCVGGVVTGCTSDGEPETCNGIDDDCDGETDNVAPGVVMTQVCSINNGLVGACATGIETCDPVLGVYSACIPDQIASPEICNGIDDDCDGQTDNVGAGTVVVDCYDGPVGTAGVGPCQKGTRTCLSDGTLGACVGQVLPEDEICDGVDNDCDGGTDENPGVMCITEPGCATGACLCAEDQEGVWRCFLD